MKNIIKNIITYLLKILSRIYLKINRIKVIAITGSAGKTTTKVALSQFLIGSDIYIPTENYNTEIGVPLVIFKEKVPEKISSFSEWIKILFRVISKTFKKSDYKMIVLEMSADKPGDIKYLTEFATPTIGVVTTVYPVHTLEFKTVENIAKEKGYVVESLPVYGTAVLNIDNKYVRLMSNRTKAKIIWIGEDKKADIRWENILFRPSGITFDLYVRGQKYKIKTKIVAPQLLTSLISAFAVGLALNFETRELIDKLQEFRPEKGRMNVIKGIKDSTILDDSYNANPASVKAALATLGKFDNRKIAVLGSMRELGTFEESGHREVIEEAIKVADQVYLVGEEMKKFAREKGKRLNKKIVQTFENSNEAAEYIKNIIEKDDVILVKGSQSTYMEVVTKAIMLEPERASEFLVRQSKMWEDKRN